MSDNQLLAGVRVLLVDDQKDTCDVFAHVLTTVGASVTCATSMHEAARFIDANDVIVTDVVIPGPLQDSVWLLERARKASRHIPVIAVSGYTEDIEPRLTGAAFDARLLKPVDPWRLCGEISAVMRRVRKEPTS